MEKQDLALVKVIKDFRVYILYSHIIAYVPNDVVKDILTQDDLDGRRGKWIATILEYYIEINPTKLIKGQGLARLMAESNCNALDITFIAQVDDQEEMATPEISAAFLDSTWYVDIIFVLLNLQAPPGFSRTKDRFLKQKEVRFSILDNVLFWRDHSGILLNCLLKEEADKTLEEFHAGDCGGCIYWKTNAEKILRASFYWPTLFAYVKRYVTSCHKCQIFEGKKKLLPLPLKPISTKFHFNNGVLPSLEKFTPHHQHNTSGF